MYKSKILKINKINLPISKKRVKLITVDKLITKYNQIRERFYYLQHQKCENR